MPSELRNSLAGTAVTWAAADTVHPTSRQATPAPIFHKPFPLNCSRNIPIALLMTNSFRWLAGLAGAVCAPPISVLLVFGLLSFSHVMNHVVTSYEYRSMYNIHCKDCPRVYMRKLG